MNFKKLLILFLIAFLANVSIFSQSKKAADISSEDSISLIVSDNEKTDADYLIESSAIQNSTNQKKSNSSWVFIRMVLVLALVIAVIYFLMNFFKKSISGNTNNDDPYLRKVAQINLGPGKSVQVVTLLENCYVIGVTDTNVNLIAQLDDKELISAMNVSADKASKSSKAKNFAEVLEMFLPSKSSKTTSATKTNIYSDSTQNVQEFVKKQRKRVNKKDE